MAVTEMARSEIVDTLREPIGEQATETLMQCVLPAGREHLATKQDLEATYQKLVASDSRLEAKMDTGFARVDARFVKVDARIDTLQGLMEGRFEGVAGRFKELEGQIAELRGLIKETAAKQSRHFIYMFAGFAILMWGTLLTLAFVAPAYRRRGIGRRLYDMRKDVCRRMNLAGIVAGGVIPGYAEHKQQMSADSYVKKVSAGKLYDPTLTMQIANGFEARGVIADYIVDPAVDNWASLIVWKNPHYSAHEPAPSPNLSYRSRLPPSLVSRKDTSTDPLTKC